MLGLLLPPVVLVMVVRLGPLFLSQKILPILDREPSLACPRFMSVLISVTVLRGLIPLLVPLEAVLVGAFEKVPKKFGL